MVEATKHRAIVGDLSTVCAKLTAAARNAQADELFILSIADTPDARIRSYELIAEGF